MKINLVMPSGEIKRIEEGTDMALLILSLFGLGSIKLFVDGRITAGIINILLLYTGFGALIHGIYLSLKPGSFIKELAQQGAKAQTQEDADKIREIAGIDLEVESN